jgi:MOSC domain-containing protein YiiM
MKNIIKTGKVLKLFVTHDDKSKKRQIVEELKVDKLGVINNKFYDKDLLRSVLITSKESYLLSENNGINLKDGSLGENILIDINPYHLSTGDKIVIGECEFEITQKCTLCKGLSTLDSKLPKLLKDDRGIFAKLTSDTPSTIKIDDEVKILNY